MRLLEWTISKSHWREVALTCDDERVVVAEDFEDEFLIGWTNGGLDSCPYFGNFLGRFGSGDKYPSKTFTGIPADATTATLEFDFYEIDSWDKLQNDCLNVIINGQRIFVGIFDAKIDEGSTSNTFGDVAIETTSRGAPCHFCFGSSAEIRSIMSR
jgi:hypothetical protein